MNITNILSLAIAVLLISCGKKESPVVPPKILSQAQTNESVSDNKKSADTIAKEKAFFRKMNNSDLIEKVLKMGSDKSVESVPYLVENVMKITPVVLWNSTDYSQTYPCTVALINIGEPAIAPIKERLLTTVSKVEQRILLSTLSQIIGSKEVVKWLDSVAPADEGNPAIQYLRERKNWVLSLNYEPHAKPRADEK